MVSGSGSSSGGGSVGQAENGNTIAHHTPVAFDAKQVAELLPMKACVEGMVAALTALSDGTAIMYVYRCCTSFSCFFCLLFFNIRSYSLYAYTYAFLSRIQTRACFPGVLIYILFLNKKITR